MSVEGIWGAGLRNAANSAAGRFLLFGLLTFIAGVSIAALERTGHAVPKSVGFALLVLAASGIVLMPVSGF